MEKDLFISTLKEKSGVDNLSERTIDEVATMFLPQFADDEKITDDTWKLPLQVVKSMSGQLRHDLSADIAAFKTKFETDNKDAQAKAIADAVAAAKAEWEKNHPDPNKKPDENNDSIDQKIADAIAKAMNGLTGDEGVLGKLNKQFGDFIKQAEEEKKAKAISNVKEQVKDHLIGLGVDEDDYALEIALEKLEIGENPDVAALKTKAQKDYETIYKRMHKDDGAQPYNNGGGGGGGKSDAEFKKFIQDRQAILAQEAKDAETLRKDMM